MRLLGTLVYFAFGALVGAAVGAIATAMLTPQSGDDLKVRIRERIDEGRVAQARAEAEMTESMKRHFRNKVGDPDAMTGAQPASSR